LCGCSCYCLSNGVLLLLSMLVGCHAAVAAN